MIAKNIKHLVRVEFCLVALISSGMSSWILSQTQPDRLVSVRVVTDEEFAEAHWNPEAILTQIALVSDRFAEKFGIRFEVKGTGNWRSDNNSRWLLELLKDMEKNVEKEGCNIVLGVTGQRYVDSFYQGAASYMSGYLLLNMSSLECGQTWTLEHEIAHLFGAVDLDESMSIMNKSDVGCNYNSYLKKVIMLHRDRDFNDLSFPLSRHECEKAIELHADRKKLRRNEPELNIMLSLIHLEMKNYAAVEKECREVIKRNTRLPEAYNLLGIALVHQGRYDEAIRAYDIAIQLQPYYHKLYYNLGVVYMKQRRYASSADCYHKALEIHPSFAHAYSNLGFVHLQQGNVDEAIDECHKALAIHPQLPEALSTLGAALIRKGEYGLAEEISKKAIEQLPSLAGPHCNLGNIYLNEGDFSAAVEELKLAVTLDPICCRGFYDLGRVYLLKGMTDGAIYAFEHAVRLDQEYYQAYSNLAAAYLRKGWYHRAIAASETALVLNPMYMLAHLNLASAYLYLGDTKRAAAACRDGINSDPHSPEPYNLLGLILEIRGESRKAEAAYRKSVELAPGYLEGHLNLGHFYYKNKNWEESIHHYRAVLEIDPDFPLIYNNLAVVYYNQGRFQIAREYLEQAKNMGMRPDPEFEQELSREIKTRRSRVQRRYP